jgi:pimeloyl-ACP methyl ester carboxylesterase
VAERAGGRPVRGRAGGLLLHGQQDMTFPAILAGHAAACIPRTTTAVALPDAGHMDRIDDPRTRMTAVRGFLAAGA